MKAFPDIEQSKKLAKILPIESADMCYNQHPLENYYSPIPHIGKYSAMHDKIPCWSLAALLNILPHCIDDRYDLVSGKLIDNKGWYVMYDDVDHFTRFYVAHSDLIDACIEMIYKLKEKNLI